MTYYPILAASQYGEISLRVFGNGVPYEGISANYHVWTMSSRISTCTSKICSNLGDDQNKQLNILVAFEDSALMDAQVAEVAVTRGEQYKISHGRLRAWKCSQVQRGRHLSVDWLVQSNGRRIVGLLEISSSRLTAQTRTTRFSDRRS